MHQSNTPSSSTSDGVKSLTDYPWYWMNATRDEVNAWLHETEEGTFLVRPSASNPNDYTLTIRKDGVNRMIKLRKDDDNIYLGMEAFANLPALVDHYQNNDLVIPQRNLKMRLVKALPSPNLSSDDKFENRCDALASLARCHADHLRTFRFYDAAFELTFELRTNIANRRHVQDTYRDMKAWFTEAIICLNNENESEQTYKELDKLIDREQQFTNMIDSIEEEIELRTKQANQLECSTNDMRSRLLHQMHKREKLTFLAQRFGVKTDFVAILLRKVHELEKQCHESSILRLLNDRKLTDAQRFDQATKLLGQLEATAPLNDDSLNKIYDGIRSLSFNTAIWPQSIDDDVAGHSAPTPPPRIESTNQMTSSNQHLNLMASGPLTRVWPIESYYIPECSLQQSNELLRYCQQGTFLLRNSKSRKGWLGLDIVYDSTVMHCLIEKDNKTGYYSFSVTSNRSSVLPSFSPPAFKSLEDFVNFYRYNSFGQLNDKLNTRLMQPLRLR